MRLSDESVIEGRHLMSEERIALQAEEIKRLRQENEQLRNDNMNAEMNLSHMTELYEQIRAQVGRMRKAIQKYILSIEKQYSIEDHHKCPNRILPFMCDKGAYKCYVRHRPRLPQSRRCGGIEEGEELITKI